VDCVFCEIARGASPASVVYEDDDAVAFMDLHPITEGHVLVIPKQHCVTLEDCPEHLVGHLATVLKKVNQMVTRAVDCQGILNEVMNGEAAGQEVFHLHWHVIPRNQGDGFGWTYPESYDPTTPSARAYLNELAAQIRSTH
jgi:histidine triad (HIT) family protein